METEVKKRKRGPNKVKYHGYTHCIPRLFWPLWKRLFCKSGWHLWYEVTPSTLIANHILYCDACADRVKIR